MLITYIHLCNDKQIPLPEVSPDRLSLFILAEIVVSDITFDSYFFQHCKIKNHHILYLYLSKVDLPRILMFTHGGMSVDFLSLTLVYLAISAQNVN